MSKFLTELDASYTYKRATPEERASRCNGCGTKGLGGWLVPDTLWGLDITEACNIHDWDYWEGRTEEDKINADSRFLDNMLKVIQEGTWILRPIRRARAMLYYSAVRDGGDAAFWKGKL